MITKRTQALGLELFSNVGIDPLARKILVVKSTNHFMGKFGPIARRVIYIESDGPLARDYRKIGVHEGEAADLASWTLKYAKLTSDLLIRTLERNTRPTPSLVALPATEPAAA
ncbi:MAG: MlrC C-terminal domain-containing protein [Betaproteobacteria bacterium]|nr:MlrC C-terminal domain-containing protein [Betaproteobacteria bacterium]